MFKAVKFIQNKILNSVFLLGSLLLCGCEFVGRQSTLDPKGPIAQMQLDVFMVTVWVTVGIFIAVGGVMLWVVLYFRETKKNKDEPIPDFKHPNPLIEWGLIALSIGLLVIVAIPTVKGIFYMTELPDEPESKLGSWYQGELSPEDEDDYLIVNVTGFQWWWSFEYPQLGITTANEFAIPVGRPVKLNLRSVDVIHSFWLPKLAGKTDLMPGRANWMWIQADELGHYYGQCAEYCGSAHAYMLFRSNALTERDFEKWVKHEQAVANVPVETMAKEGEKLFATKSCIQCHTIAGNPIAMGVKGPNLTHVASRRSLAAGFLDNMDIHGNIDLEMQKKNMFNWVKESQHIKPGNLMYYDVGGLKDVDLTDADVHKLVAYLQGLK